MHGTIVKPLRAWEGAGVPRLEDHPSGRRGVGAGFVVCSSAEIRRSLLSLRRTNDWCAVASARRSAGFRLRRTSWTTAPPLRHWLGPTTPRARLASSSSGAFFTAGARVSGWSDERGEQAEGLNLGRTACSVLQRNRRRAGAGSMLQTVIPVGGRRRAPRRSSRGSTFDARRVSRRRSPMLPAAGLSVHDSGTLDARLALASNDPARAIAVAAAARALSPDDPEIQIDTDRLEAPPGCRRAIFPPRCRAEPGARACGRSRRRAQAVAVPQQPRNVAAAARPLR